MRITGILGIFGIFKLSQKLCLHRPRGIMGITKYWECWEYWKMTVDLKVWVIGIMRIFGITGIFGILKWYWLTYHCTGRIKNIR